MKIIPVIDILNGVAVHAVRGNRKEYQPLKSVLCKTADPLEVACVFRSLGFRELYVADLDAILHQTANYPLFSEIVQKTGLKLMVDAGVTTLDAAQKLLNCGVSKIIVGTETLTHKDFVSEIIWEVGRNNVVVSLDMKNGAILGLNEKQDPQALLSDFEGMGISEFIVLDLTRVGSNEGVDTVFLKKIIEQTRSSVYVGGGIRTIEDLVELENLGASGVLLATALHEGKISVADLKFERLL
ncbi:MAG: HisA/HisF-related TIM barrel protein [Candidatus Bathyarchaeota archaeon]|nr:HisA/HisF-related TIM barrel protein [Candidatus Bathyarchaeota archaeon]